MTADLVICVPGDWQDRSDLLRRVIESEPRGRKMFAGAILADLDADDHVPLELRGPDADMGRAFEIAGQGKIPPEVLARIEAHAGVAYLHFPANLPEQRDRVLKYTGLLQRLGGIAVKVESAGVAHTWERWQQLLGGGTPFDLYCAAVVLVGDTDSYFSCGMHLFGLPDCEVSRAVTPSDAAALMNEFNVWRIVERPVLADGHTFGVAADAPRFRLALAADARHEPDDMFHNPSGLWRLGAV
jgi:hypothetical protein